MKRDTDALPIPLIVSITFVTSSRTIRIMEERNSVFPDQLFLIC